MYHAVSDWVPAPVPKDWAITSRRMSTVFFTPHEMMTQLKDKEPGWAKRTGYGSQWSRVVGKGEGSAREVEYEE